MNKGDEVNPDYRSRLVAKAIKTDKREDRFAATSPLEAKKALFSLAVAQGVGWGVSGGPMKIEFIDISTAFFHAEARREVYIQLPPEDGEPGCVLGYGKPSMAQEMLHRIGSMSTQVISRV